MVLTYDWLSHIWLIVTSPRETLTNATPTEGVTPRASLIEQMILCDSLWPRIEDAVVARDLRPDAVVGRVPGRDVDAREMVATELVVEWR
jgi:hypothetical protein